MEFKSIPDILKFSISKEQASIQFYRDLLRHLADPATQSLFEVLIQKEQEHIEALQLEIEKLGHTVDTDTEKLDPQNPKTPVEWYIRFVGFFYIDIDNN